MIDKKNKTLIRVIELSKYFPIRSTTLFRREAIKAVDNVSFEIKAGETLALMGESGCGKTTCALTIIRLLEPTKGDVIFGGERLFALEGEDLRGIRRNMQVVLQNPLASLDPRITLRQTIREPLIIHRHELKVSSEEIEARVVELARRVGLEGEELDRYPRDLSGGQQQRGCICRALILEPEFLVLDEPTSSLDVSVQARTLNLLLDLREEFGLTYLFVTHNAAVARYVGDRVAIMYLGNLVELGGVEEVFGEPVHPYTKALIGSVLSPRTTLDQVSVILKGTPEAPLKLPPGCVFQRRCREVSSECFTHKPELKEVSLGHFVACNHE